MPIRNHHGMLEHIARGLDISPPRYLAAERRYKLIGEWLGREHSELSSYEITIFPQGSFLLGTVTRPIFKTEQYDVDVICRVDSSKRVFTQRQLKESIGNEVRSYANADEHAILPLKEGRICWALKYDDDAQFHVDIVPALPDEEPYREALRRFGHFNLAGNADLSGHAIAITDNTSPRYSEISEDWPSSNPLGYAAWFRRRMEQRFVQTRETLAMARAAAHVDDIPEYEVKTPLQRAIQLLKRHRDVFFQDRPKSRPASIIVTTLAAHAYGEEGDIASALVSILDGMQNYIFDREDAAWIPNPVYPEENFADGWCEVPEKRADFDIWLRAAQKDFGTYLRASQYDNFPHDLRRRLGTDLVDRTLGSIPPVAAAAAAAESDSVFRAKVEADNIRKRGPTSKPWARG